MSLDQQSIRPVLGLEVMQSNEWIGGVIYIRNLIYCFDSIPLSERPIIRPLGIELVAQSFRQELESFDHVEKMNLPARDPGALERLLHRARRKLFNYQPAPADRRPLDAIYPGFRPKLPGVAHIRWIPDLQHIRMPQFFTAAELKARDASFAEVADSRGILVLSSESARRDFEDAFPNSRVKKRVWHFCTVLTAHELSGADPHQTYQLPERYLYLPNQFWAHKNHITMFRALKALKDQGVRIPLVCTGHENDNRNPNHMRDLRNFLTENDLQEDVRFLGLVPRSDQIQIFRHATAIIQPSLFEGWSTVVEDCKALGRPLLASDIDVHQEQLAGDHPLPLVQFFEPKNDAALAELIAKTWANLPSGPNPAQEAIAQTYTHRRQRSNAYGFLDIIKEAMAIERTLNQNQ